MAFLGEAGQERSPDPFHFFFDSFVLSLERSVSDFLFDSFVLSQEEVFKKITATATSSREADMLSRFFVRNFLPCEIVRYTFSEIYIQKNF